jgi:hypothetical protein
MGGQTYQDVIVGGRAIRFWPVRLDFEDGELEHSLFGQKNNKTLGETLAHRRYAGLRAELGHEFQSRLDEPIGRVLASLKAEGDTRYRRFLNRNGDLSYCRFRAAEHTILDQKGLYVFRERGGIRYVGRCRDSFRNRFNNGYGKISPKNCYLDGQSTNCRLNALIAVSREKISLLVCPIDADAAIKTLESTLIQFLEPSWNQQIPWEK